MQDTFVWVVAYYLVQKRGPAETMLQVLRDSQVCVWFSLQDENIASWLLGYFVNDSEPQSDILGATIMKIKILTKSATILGDLYSLCASRSL